MKALSKKQEEKKESGVSGISPSELTALFTLILFIELLSNSFGPDILEHVIKIWGETKRAPAGLWLTFITRCVELRAVCAGLLYFNKR